MPRSQESPVGRILKAIRGMELEIAKVTVGLVHDELRERLQRSADAKKRAIKVVDPFVAQHITHGGKPQPKKSHKKKAAKKAAKPDPFTPALSE